MMATSTGSLNNVKHLLAHHQATTTVNLMDNNSATQLPYSLRSPKAMKTLRELYWMLVLIP